MRSSKITGVLAAALLIGWSGIGPAAAHPADQVTFDDIETSTADCGSIQLSLTVEDAGWFVATRHGGVCTTRRTEPAPRRP
jgi:hypothetical protein